LKDVIKLKNTKPVRGFATVELFNESGKKVLEEKSENSLTYLETNRLIWNVKRDFYTGHPSGALGEPYYPIYNLILDSSTDPIIYTSSMLCKNISTIIGWSSKGTYSGSDTLRGTVNPVESYWTNEKVRWVFDFPTHAANGTFQRVVWGSYREGSNVYNYTTIRSFSHPSLSPQGLAWDGTYLWTAGENQKKIFKIDPITGTVLTSFSTTGYPRGLAHDGTYLWLVTSQEILQKINPATGEVLTAFTGFRAGGITWDGSYLRVTNRNTYTIDKINPSNGSLISSIPFPSGITSVPGLAWHGNNLWVGAWDNDTIYRVNPDTGLVLGAMPFPDGEPRGLTCDNTGLWATGYYYQKIQKIDAAIGSITRLPNPVTKTNDKTMKVTYDFIFEE